MARYRKKPLLPWASGHADGREKRFVQIGAAFLFHPKVAKLDAGPFRLYICMLNQAAGNSQFEFPKHVAKKMGISSSSLLRWKDALIKAGFIRVIRHGKTTREPDLYEFSLKWKNK